ncbi:DUF6215 domain-containing protein [Streptomyces antibioticus]|uniref:Uncharacterized protein n=1 Tax=Streptomyces antibioticus TaxID=1890 RepID=A0AAE7CIX3_STRAT|nr:DUF6215 domain-containing protein [Streptomyces antibioticus]OOQ55148.1 hypothetical protein AFM16_03795 [Streptomyces antibioticus]QIT42787.1 hypothetical protein HCX60_03995 [Streptomyces antibioticus]
MVDEVVEPEKGMRAGTQVVAAVVLVGGVAGLMWALAGALPQGAAEDERPAACSTSTTEPPPPELRVPGVVSGDRLCTALNRPDLASLLGTPQEHTETADGHDFAFELAAGSKIAIPEATVTLDTYSVKITATYDGLPVEGSEDLLGGGAESRTFLGHPAVLYSNPTIAFKVDLGGGDAETGPGGIARSLLVAQDAKDGGGSYEIAIWRQDDVLPDDAALLRVAEKVLPTLPGWSHA